MSGVLNLLLAGAASAIKDAYFNLTTLLLNTSSTNGAQNNTFLDSSTNNFTITRNGNTTQGTFSPFSQTGWSNYFNGSSQLSTVANPNLAFGTGAITFECWINTLSTNNMGMWGTTNEAAWTANSYAFNYYNGDIILWNNSTLWSIAVGTLHDGNWHHVAIVRSGTTWQVFVDGVSKGTTTTEGSRDLGNNAWRVGIGQIEPSGGDTKFFIGYLSNMRVSNTAIYTSNFTPSTTPLTTTSQGVSSANVKFLSIQSNRFVDNSTNATTFTLIGTPSVQAFSPFAPTAAYDTSVVGGSGYFDGTGDYLTAADNANLELGSGDFTIECWINTTVSNSGYVSAVSKWGASNQSYMIRAASTDIGAGWSFFYSTNGTNYFTVFGSAINDGAWHHVAVTRSGNVFRTFTDGVLKNSTTDAVTLYNGTSAVTIGSGDAGANPFTGYISDVRIVKGTALYTATFTPPTAPLTAITNTSLLLSCTNAGIYDSAAKNDLETVGNAQVSTTQAKWGTTSMYFDGTGDYLLYRSNALSSISGDFTVEGWIYPISWGSNSIIIGQTSSSQIGRYGSTGSAFGIVIAGGWVITDAALPSTSVWTHFAVVRQSGTVKIYMNGTQSGSSASNTGTLSMNCVGSASGSGDYNGYIDDLRVTNYARYTANFTAPTAAFPLQ